MRNKWYGSINNRIDENKMYCDKIEVGTKMTEYSWSDRKPYEVVEVVDQKHIFVRELDHKHVGNSHMDNNWELISNNNNPVIELKFKYNKWNRVVTYSKDYLTKSIIQDPIIVKKIKEVGYCNVYNPINVSFGIAEYYYDYEF